MSSVFFQLATAHKRARGLRAEILGAGGEVPNFPDAANNWQLPFDKRLAMANEEVELLTATLAVAKGTQAAAVPKGTTPAAPPSGADDGRLTPAEAVAHRALMAKTDRVLATKGAKAPAAPTAAAPAARVMLRSEFEKLSPLAKAGWCLQGGLLREDPAPAAAPAGRPAAARHPHHGGSMARHEFEGLSARDRAEHIRAGGTLI